MGNLNCRTQQEEEEEELLIQKTKVSRTKERVKQLSKLSVGDAICYRHKGYKHHAIIVETQEPNKYQVIHLTGNSHLSTGSILSKGPKAKVMKEEKTFSKRDKMYKYKYSSSRDDAIQPDDVARVICENTQEVRYHFLNFNCEHFVSYCVTGVAFSGQSQQVKKSGINQEMITHLDNIIAKWTRDENNSSS